MNKYLKLIDSGTPYATKMTRLRNRIFGDVVRRTDSSSMRVVKMFQKKPIYMDDEVVNYYPRHTDICNLMKHLRHYGLYRDEFEDFKDEMERLRQLKGKVKDQKDKNVK